MLGLGVSAAADEALMMLPALGLVDHDPTGGLAAEEDPLQVDREDPVEVLLGLVEERTLDHDAGDVAPDVDAAPLGRHPLGQRVDLGAVTDDVEPGPFGRSAGGADLLGGGLRRCRRGCRRRRTVAPAPASASALARPMPLPAPVTTATLPSTRNDSMRVVASISCRLSRFVSPPAAGRAADHAKSRSVQTERFGALWCPEDQESDASAGEVGVLVRPRGSSASASGGASTSTSSSATTGSSSVSSLSARPPVMTVIPKLGVSVSYFGDQPPSSA